MADCKRNSKYLVNQRFQKGNTVLFVEQYRCGGKDQFWLMSRVDRLGKTLTAKDLSFDPQRLDEERIYTIEDIFFLNRIPRGYRPFIECGGYGLDSEEDVPFSFAVAQPVPTYQENPRMQIGADAKNISEAWKVNLDLRKFERMTTKGLTCEEGH